MNVAIVLLLIALALAVLGLLVKGLLWLLFIGVLVALAAIALGAASRRRLSARCGSLAPLAERVGAGDDRRELLVGQREHRQPVAPGQQR